MSQPSKHLLEAFTASRATPASPPRAVAPGPSKPAAQTPSLFANSTAERGILVQRSQVPLLLVVLVLALVCSFLVGRASVSTSAAGDSSVEAASKTASVAPQQQQAPPSSAVQPTTPSRADLDRQARSPAEQALLDARNVYTIKLLEYTAGDSNKARALETLRYLTDQAQLPACVTSTSSRILILVGAAPKQSELDTLLERCKTIAGPPPLNKKAEFHDAYFVKIDSVFPRNH